MTRDQFNTLYAVSQATHPDYARDTLRRINDQVFAEVADLFAGLTSTETAVIDAFNEAFQEA